MNCNALPIKIKTLRVVAMPEEQEKTRHNLLEYCKLDTIAMVKLWEKLKEVIA